MPSRSARALSSIRAAMTKPPSGSRGLRGGVFLKSRARDCSFSLFITKIVFALSWYPWILALMRGRTSGPNPLGPLVAAVIVIAIVYGRSGLREFFRRLIRWRVGAKWYAVSFVTPIVLCLIAIGITLWFAPPVSGP